jgi:uncharacterized protein YjiK
LKRKSLTLISALLAPPLALALAAGSTLGGADVLRYVRAIEADDVGPPGRPGLPFPPGSEARLVLDAPNQGAATIVLPGEPDLSLEISDPINLAFAPWADGSAWVLALDTSRGELLRIEIGRPNGANSPQLQLLETAHYDIGQARGMTIDAATGQLYILDASRKKIVRIDAAGAPGPGLPPTRLDGPVAEIDLPKGLGALRGIAVDPANGNLHLLSASAHDLYEVDSEGRLVRLRDLSAWGPLQPHAMTFAPSSDRTDDADRSHLFLVASLGSNKAPRVTEWSLGGSALRGSPFLGRVATATATLAAAVPEDATLVQVIDAFDFDPPSPDSAGLAYQQRTDSLLMSDSEVNEMSIYEDVNVFELTRSGSLFGRFDTTDFSDEPTGLAIDSASQHCFVSDDTSPSEIFVVDPGADDVCFTGDDDVRSFETGDFDSGDPEGLAFGQGTLFVADGVNNEIYAISPGSNGVFDGAPPSGDDEVTSCDTSALGIEDPEGLAFDAGTGDLFVVGKGTTDLAQVSTACELVRMLDISEANLERPAGLALAPSSVDPSVLSLWLADRGVDNDGDPDENDGRIFEFTLPFLAPGNVPPIVSAGPDQTLEFPSEVLLEGSASDDGVPQPGSLTVRWSQVSGPGVVAFDREDRETTTALFSAPGSYVVRLTGDDGQLQSSEATRRPSPSRAPGAGRSSRRACRLAPTTPRRMRTATSSARAETWSWSSTAVSRRSDFASPPSASPEVPASSTPTFSSRWTRRARRRQRSRSRVRPSTSRRPSSRRPATFHPERARAPPHRGVRLRGTVPAPPGPISARRISARSSRRSSTATVGRLATRSRSS